MPASENIWPSVLYKVLRGSYGGRTSPCRIGCSAVSATAATSLSFAGRSLVPEGSGAVPDVGGDVRLVRQPERLRSAAGRDLKDIAVVIVVVGDHVEHVKPLHLGLRQLMEAAVGQPHA